MYTFGSAGSSSTNKANLKALQQWKIIPRMLRDASTRSLEVRFPPLFFLSLRNILSLFLL